MSVETYKVGPSQDWPVLQVRFRIHSKEATLVMVNPWAGCPCRSKFELQCVRHECFHGNHTRTHNTVHEGEGACHDAGEFREFKFGAKPVSNNNITRRGIETGFLAFLILRSKGKIDTTVRVKANCVIAPAHSLKGRHHR